MYQFKNFLQGAPDFIHIQPYKREIANLTDDGIEFLFKLQILIFFDPGKNVTSASARIYCQHAMNPKISKSYAVFLRHGNMIRAITNSVLILITAMYIRGYIFLFRKAPLC